MLRKYFFLEQLKILSKFILDHPEKIQSPRMIYRKKINDLNDLYKDLYTFPYSDKIEECFELKIKHLQKLRDPVECPKFGQWKDISSCSPFCGNGKKTQGRTCIGTSGAVEPPEIVCTRNKNEIQNDLMTRESSCYTHCSQSWSGLILSFSI